MQVIFIPEWMMLLSYIIIWPLLQTIAALIGNSMADKHFDINSIYFKVKKWEKKGLFYRKTFKIHKWKGLLPDGARVHKKGFRKKSLESFDKEYLQAFIAETCRAEFIHCLQIIPFWVFGLWSPPYFIWLMLIYSLAVNLPCIMAQRYNRPRLLRILNKLNDK